MLNIRKQRGFNLIELMIAATAGLVVSAATITFISATIESSGATIRSTRLTQELRALSEVVARDIRRARSLSDPISRVGSNCIAGNTCNFTTIDTATAGCIRFAYDRDGTADDAAAARAIRRVDAGGRGQLQLALGTIAAPPACNAAGTTLNSALVDVTAFTVTAVGPSQFNISLTGRLVGDASGVQQTYTTSVYVRSGFFVSAVTP